MTGAALTGWGVLGLVGGWLLHRFIDQGTGPAPMVSWAQPLALLLVAAILFGTAWSTQRSIRQHTGRLAPHHAVNRLVLARACAYVGCLMAGGYFGYAVSWVGVDSDLAHQRELRSALAGVAGVLAVVAALLLERACRVPGDHDEP
jgi:hypothetical protein